MYYENEDWRLESSNTEKVVERRSLRVWWKGHRTLGVVDGPSDVERCGWGDRLKLLWMEILGENFS